MRIVFLGTPDFAVPTLDALVEAGHDVVAVYTQPPRPGGRRGRERVASAVHRRAEALGIAVRHPERLRGEDELAAFRSLDTDIGVVAAYGLILPRAILAAPRLGCLNVHGSLLPRWRGAAPIQRAILAGDRETGVGIMRMDVGLDTGPVLREERTPVADKTAGELASELAWIGARLMVETLAEPIPAGRPQPGVGITYADKIDKAETRLEFTATAVAIERAVRAFAPAPGAWFEVRGERVRVLAADIVAAEGSPGLILDDALTIACGSGAIRPTAVQRAGRGVTTAAALLNGFSIPRGSRIE